MHDRHVMYTRRISWQPVHAVTPTGRLSHLETSSPVFQENVSLTGGGVQTKMTEIGNLISSLHEPVILFVQWKSMVRSTRSFLSVMGVRVLLLDGNTAQRTAILSEFMSAGVLLLCLEESFAGLHLAHVRQIIFCSCNSG